MMRPRGGFLYYDLDHVRSRRRLVIVNDVPDIVTDR
jgi:hypothetical protein